MPNFKRPRFKNSHKHVTEAVGAKSRAAAAKIVVAVEEGQSLSEAFPIFCADFDSRDTAFIKEIVYGTLRHRRLLMSTLKPMFDFKITERDRIVPALLLTAFYQIVFMRSPAHAVVAATVSACGDVGKKSFTSLVNAILRRFLREGAKLVHTSNNAVEFSFPDWLYNKLEATYGAEQARSIVLKSNEKAPLFLRVENSKISTKDFIDRLQEQDIVAYPLDICPSTVRLENATNVFDIPGFNDGICTVQDVSAQLAAPLLKLDSEAALRVLDCCCAPGGKTAHILDLSPKSQVVALDVDEARLEQTKATLSRLNRMDNVTLMALDAQELDKIEGNFDRILVDAPCSGTGVIRRHPDIKWLRRQKDIAALCQIQANILDAAYNKLNSGGVLLYTTCSILKEENQDQVTAFLERHSEAILEPIELEGHSYETLQRLPGDHLGDGFFYARIIKP